MSVGLGVALVLVFGFAFTNGIHDASNAIANRRCSRIGESAIAEPIQYAAVEST